LMCSSGNVVKRMNGLTIFKVNLNKHGKDEKIK
jgi:hypothetical protein